MSGSTPVWLNGAAKPVELTSPNFPGNSNTSSVDCEWVVRPRFGTKVSPDSLFNLAQVKVTFVHADMGTGCQSNSLTVWDTSKGGKLSFPGLRAKCGVNNLPAPYDPIVSDGPVHVRYVS